jgi:hypothetical protein
MKTIKDTCTITIGEVNLDIQYTYSFDSGYWRNSNGDGLPPSQDLEISSIKIGNIECFDLFFDTCMWETIENEVLEKI